MSEKVVGVRGATPQFEPVPEIVETLESLLEKARSGQI